MVRLEVLIVGILKSSFRIASERAVGDVGADIFVDGECNGFGWRNKRTGVGHSTLEKYDGVVVVCPVVSCCPSSCPPVCPPPARSAPGSSSFPPCFVPLPPIHSALDSGDVDSVCCFSNGGCVLARPLFAGASVARPGSSVLSFGVGLFASYDSLHPAGSLRFPSRNIAVAGRSVRSRQSKCCSASAQRGLGAVAASLGVPGMAPIQSSKKVILYRQVIIVDLGLAGSCAIVDNGSVVGSVSGRQPQQLPSSLHCVLRLRGGVSTTSSSDDGTAGGDDVSSAGSVDFVIGAAGSGNGHWSRIAEWLWWRYSKESVGRSAC